MSLEILIDNNVSSLFEATDAKGRTGLHIAANSGHLDMVQVREKSHP